MPVANGREPQARAASSRIVRPATAIASRSCTDSERSSASGSSSARAAADAARERLRALPHATVECRELPEAFPAGPFELIVCSEVLYYLDDAAFSATITAIERELAAGGSLLAVHWRPVTETYPMTGDEVHERLAARFGPAARSERTPEYALDRFDVA